MNQPSETNDASSKQDILETTLAAVRDKQQRKRRNQNIITSSCALAAVVFVLMLTLRDDRTPEPDNPAAVKSPSQPNTAPSSVISLVDRTEVKTLTLSHIELARLVYNPRFKFIEEEDVFTWRSESVIIHMPMPRTLMAITESPEPDPDDDIL